MRKPFTASILLISMLSLFLVTGKTGAEEKECAQFEKNLDRCEIEYDVKLRCEKGSLIMGGDVISTSHSAKMLEEHIKFNDDFEYKIENHGKGRYKILCKKKTPKGVWGSMKEVLEYKKQKAFSPYFSKKEDQARYLVTRGENNPAYGQKQDNKSLENKFLVLIPEIPLSIRNTDTRPCEFKILDQAGEMKVKQIVASGETFLANTEKIGLQVGREYLLNRISGDVVEVAHLVVAKDENTTAIANVLSEIDADSSYTKEEKRILKIDFLNRINDLYDQYKLYWLVVFLESQ